MDLFEKDHQMIMRLHQRRMSRTVYDVPTDRSTQITRGEWDFLNTLNFYQKIPLAAFMVQPGQVQSLSR